MIEDIQQDIVELLKDLHYNIDRDYADELKINYEGNIVRLEVDFISSKSDVRYNIVYNIKDDEINIVNTCTHLDLEAIKELSSPTNKEIYKWFNKIVEYINHKEEAIEREMAYNKKNYGRGWI